jgi:nicotinamidase-related amidase
MGEIVNRSAQLARAFRERAFPVVLVNATGRAPGRTEGRSPKFSFSPDWSELVPELEPQSDDCLISKQRVGAFLGTSLDEILRQRGATQVFVAGVSTCMGVESTARGTYDLGYNVVLVVDAMTDRAADAHRHSVKRIFPRLGETADTEEVLLLLRQQRI